MVLIIEKKFIWSVFFEQKLFYGDMHQKKTPGKHRAFMKNTIEC